MTSNADFRDMTRTLYRAVSAAPGERDWEAVRPHYHPEASVRGRGVNFFTLIHTGGRWQIMSIVWDNERSGVSLSEAGLLTA